MRLGDALAVGVVTVFWIGFDLYLLLDPVLAAGLSGLIGTSPLVLELIVLIVGGFATWGTHWAAENAE